MTDERFDQLLKEMREEHVAPERMAAARGRVWERLAASPACAEFRPQFGDYLAERLPEPRRLLMEDHLSRCAECRRALAEAKGAPAVIPMPLSRRRWLPSTRLRWAMAAGVVLGVVYLGRGPIDSALAPSGPRATVLSVSGEAYVLPQEMLEPGAAVAEGEIVRTMAGSHALLGLADGSQVEMNQRTQLSVTAAWSGQTIRLDRGDVIVQAAKQRRGNLRVVTRDSVASVQGTVFAVSSGTAGSVVSVVEGRVEVLQPGARRVLAQGERSASNPALQQVDVRRSVSWSRDAGRYYALLAEFAGIEKRLAETPGRAVRTEARLLRYLPDGALVYLAFPNLSGTIRQALYQFEQRAGENAVLKEWWSSPQGEEFRKTLDRLQAITPYFGEEMALVLARDPARANDVRPLLLAQVQRGREDALGDALGRMAGELNPGNPSEPVPYSVTPELFVLSESAAALRSMSTALGRGASSPFAAEIARRYQSGVSWLAAVDLTAFPEKDRLSVEGRMIGLPNMRYLFLEQGTGGNADENQATLTFQGARQGIASWLAPSGAAGSTDYISADAIAVLSASTRDPRQAFDEILSLIGDDRSFISDLRRFESEAGVSIGADIAATLGTDFTFAVERPTVPIPGWVAVFEVVRPAVLDDTIRRLAEAFNRQLPADQAAHNVTLTQENVNGRTWMTLRHSTALALHWTYDRGYLIASMDRAVAAQAIATRESGSSLVRSVVFQDRFPTGGLHHSGFVWLNTGKALAGLAELVSMPAVRTLMTGRDPVLVVIDGETERIHAASRTRLTSLVVDLMLVHSGVPGAKL